MPLWVDDDFVTVNDMMSLDPEVVEVAETEGIVISGNSGIIRRAKEDCQATLSKFMSFSGLSQTDLSIRNVNLPLGTPDLRYNFAGFAQVVVTGDSSDSWSALKRWAVAAALRKFYRAASNKAKDRYADRLDGIHTDIMRDYWPNFWKRGLPLVFNPLDAPGAISSRCGLFGPSNVQLVDGPGASASSFDYAITWVGSRYVAPANKYNNESYRSARVTLASIAGKVASINKTNLVAPNGNQPAFTLSSCRYSPGVAVGWNVWACATPDPDVDKGAAFDYPVMYRQNPAVIAGNTFTLPGDPVLAGETLDFGQYEDVVLEMRNELQRC